MIPYEDLVVALQAWRVKQGLPVGSLAPVASSAPVAASASSSSTSMPSSGPGSPSSTPILGSRVISDASSGPRTSSPVAARPGPPGPPPRSPTPPPLAPPDSIDEPVDDAALIEEAQYDEAEPASDYAMAFDHDAPPAHHEGEVEGTTVDGPDGLAGRSKPPRGDW